MADAYEICRPIWRLYPELDPAKHTDPLGLDQRPNHLRDTPEDLRAVLERMSAAASSALPALAAAFPAEERVLSAVTAALVAGTQRAQDVISEAALSAK
jgi:hypothetical protein